MRRGSAKHLSHGRNGKWDPAGILVEHPPLAGAMDLVCLFGNRRPVEVEIGTGKGTFLLARAPARTDLNFLGVEYARAYCLYAADRFRRAGLTNVRLIHTDAAHLFSAALADGTVWRVHLYFPDPWPKRKHRRRRLVQPSFAAELRRVLRLGGQVLLATDHLEYYREIRRVWDYAQGFAAVPFPRLSGQTGVVVGTNFERKYAAQGRSIYRLARMRYA